MSALLRRGKRRIAAIEYRGRHVPQRLRDAVTMLERARAPKAIERAERRVLNAIEASRGKPGRPRKGVS